MCPASYSTLGAHVDEHDVAAREPLEQVLATDRVDVLADVVARGALDLGQARGRRVAQRQPQPQRLVAGQRVTHACALARAGDHARGAQRLQMLRSVRLRLPARPRELVDAAGRLGEQVEQLEAHGAGERLAHQRDRLEQRVLRRPGSSPLLVKRSIDSLSSVPALTKRGRRVLPATAQRRHGVRVLRARLSDARAVRRRRPAHRPRRRLHRAGRGTGRADRRGARDARAGRPRLRAAGARRAHRSDRVPPGGRRRRLRPSRARRRRRRRSSATPRSGRSRRPATRWRTTPTWSPISGGRPSRGWS